MQINVTQADTIWNRLALNLGREPTLQEVKQNVRRILDEAMVDAAEAGRLKHQRAEHDRRT